MKTSRRDFLALSGFVSAGIATCPTDFAATRELEGLTAGAETTDLTLPFPPDLSPPFGALRRLSANPILGPRGDGFESAGVFNPAVVAKGGEIVMLYRAQDRGGTSRIGYATSADGFWCK